LTNSNLPLVDGVGARSEPASGAKVQFWETEQGEIHIYLRIDTQHCRASYVEIQHKILHPMYIKSSKMIKSGNRATSFLCTAHAASMKGHHPLRWTHKSCSI